MSISSKAPFIGIGTGRCGTNSLRRIVSACNNYQVTHESLQFHWYELDDKIGKLIRDMKEHTKLGIVRGEVSQALLPWIADLRSGVPDLKVVCLHRDKAETIRSFMEYGSHMIRPRDKRKWSDGARGIRASAVRCFPVIDAASPEQAFGFYWEMYEEMSALVAEPVLHIRTEELNEDSKVGELFDFLGVPLEDRILIEKRKWWTSEDAAVVRKEAYATARGQVRRLRGGDVTGYGR